MLIQDYLFLLKDFTNYILETNLYTLTIYIFICKPTVNGIDKLLIVGNKGIETGDYMEGRIYIKELKKKNYKQNVQRLLIIKPIIRESRI
tara:strand:+ start:274 stop:543 length:270 start_codon:yes stop_codon:yes gene_type:complete